MQVDTFIAAWFLIMATSWSLVEQMPRTMCSEALRSLTWLPTPGWRNQAFQSILILSSRSSTATMITFQHSSREKQLDNFISLIFVLNRIFYEQSAMIKDFSFYKKLEGSEYVFNFSHRIWIRIFLTVGSGSDFSRESDPDAGHLNTLPSTA